MNLFILMVLFIIKEKDVGRFFFSYIYYFENGSNKYVDLLMLYE